jgi:lysophospholipase L1-like esterase
MSGWRRAVGLALSVVAVAAFGTAAPAATRPLSIVQLGDSIASGEGTLYGYQYDAQAQTWMGGNVNVTWPGPDPDCHVSPDAYGNVVARSLHARFTTFACTGARYTNGIIAPETDTGVLGTTTLRPAEFGDWANRTDLNAAYDAAKPDLVLVTLGADDLRFVPVVTDCVENALATGAGLETLRCTAANPGPTITTDVQDQLSTLGTNLTTLLGAIRARGQAAQRVPKIVVTTYHDPLPSPATTRCPDVNLLQPAQVAYLATLVSAINTEIRTTVRGAHLPGVALADTSHAMTGADGRNHRWCSTQPWAYGLSIFKLTDPASLLSQAPFHPTPAGQRRYAALVLPVARRLVGR